MIIHCFAWLIIADVVGVVAVKDVDVVGLLAKTALIEFNTLSALVLFCMTVCSSLS